VKHNRDNRPTAYADTLFDSHDQSLILSSDPDLPAIERKIQSADDYRRNR
jgi:hypothetical protein